MKDIKDLSDRNLRERIAIHSIGVNGIFYPTRAEEIYRWVIANPNLGQDRSKQDRAPKKDPIVQTIVAKMYGGKIPKRKRKYTKKSKYWTKKK